MQKYQSQSYKVRLVKIAEVGSTLLGLHSK